jgi:hypothetical protein
MTLTHADISALADQMAPMVARMVAQLLQGQQVDQPQPVIDESERIRRQAHALNGQGRFEESKALLRSFSSSTRRTSHA